MQQQKLIKNLNLSKEYESGKCDNSNCTNTNFKVYKDLVNKVKFARCTNCGTVKMEGIL